MSDVKVSVVVPVYNCEKYLRQCLDSLKNQTIREFEVICVNDCSTDASGKILEEYREMDNRFRIIDNQKNQRAGYSRNQGIRAARGKYIYFVDGDDFCEKEMLMKCFCAAEEHNADIVLCDYIFYDSTSGEKRAVKTEEPIRRMISKKVFNYKTFASYLFNGWRSVPWNRLYKRDFLRENKLFFSEIDNSEDVFFTNAALVDAERIFYLEKSCYYTYRDNNSGQLSRNLSGDIYCVAKELEKLKRKLTEEGIFESLKSSFWNYSVCAINPSLLNLNEEQQRELAGYYKEVWIPKTDMPVTNAEMFGYVEQYLTIKNICLREYTGYNCFLETYKMNLHSEDILRRIAVFFDKIQGRRSAIWGAGGRSREISVFLRDNDYEVECFLDNDEKKHGQFLEGRRIEAPSKLLEDLEWIIVLNKTFLYDVCRQIFTAGYKHIKVFDMETYVYPRYTIEECTITEGMLSIL